MIALDVTVHRHLDPGDPTDDRVARVVWEVLSAEQADGEWVVSVVFVDDAEIQEMHRDYMQIDEPTDIMTFPSDPDFDGVVGGDLVISVDTARLQAPDHNQSTSQELEFLIAHGVLHLLDWDDKDPNDRIRMLDRQREILAGLA